MLSLRFLIERANPKLHWNAGVTASLYRISINYKIPFIFYAEHGETNYGGTVLSKDSEKKRDYEEIIENLIGDDPYNWENSDISISDLSPYLMPSQEELDLMNIEAHYFGYYFPWDIKNNYEYVMQILNSICTQMEELLVPLQTLILLMIIWTIYYYLQYIKYGFGRATRDASRHIQFISK